MKTNLLIIVLSLLLFASCDQQRVYDQEDVRLPEKLTLPDKNDSKRKIVALGDSLTAGFGLAERESYPFLLQQKLRKDGYDYEVVNAGVSGDTSLGGLERAEWVLGQENVEILILALGGNDLLRGVPPENMRKNLEGIIRKAKEKNIRILLCGMLAPDTMGKDYQERFIKTFPDLAKKYDVEFLPFLLNDVALEKDLNQPDGIHPNAKGTVIMTNNIYAGLKPLLQKNS